MPKTLAQQVDDLACRCIKLDNLAAEMLATIQLNFERGYLVAVNDDGKLNLAKIITMWQKQLGELSHAHTTTSTPDRGPDPVPPFFSNRC